MDLHHPLFQSLALPLGAAFGATGLLRAALGPVDGARWAAAGVAVALLGTLSWVLGWRWAPGAMTEKLPWVCAAAAVVGLGLEARRAGRRTQWIAACFLWASTIALLGPQALSLQVGAWLVGACVIGTALAEAPRRADGVAALTVASIGLAALAMLSGSALLFELALGLGAAVAGCALWLWPVARIAFGASGIVVALLAWLALAQGTALQLPGRPGPLLLLAAAFGSGPLVRFAGRRLHRGEMRPWVEALVVAGVAAAWVAAALALAHWGGSGAAAANIDDPYYKPAW